MLLVLGQVYVQCLIRQNCTTPSQNYCFSIFHRSGVFALFLPIAGFFFGGGGIFCVMKATSISHDSYGINNQHFSQQNSNH